MKPDVQLAQEEEEGDVEEEEEEEEEREEVNAFSFLKFVKTLVVHFTAKRALERHCLRIKDQDVNVSLFSVDRSALAIPAGSWSTMKDMMRELLSSDPSDDTATATKALEILEGKILQPRQDNPKQNNLLANFKLIIEDQPILLPGGMHCETVLATIGKYFESILKGDGSDDNVNLTTICKVLLLFYLLTHPI
jgi:hypothetical protein